MKLEKTVIAIMFLVLTAFLFPMFQEAVINAGYTGTFAPIINNLPAIFLLCGIIMPFVAYGLDNQ